MLRLAVLGQPLLRVTRSSSLPAVRSSWSFAGVPGAQRLWMAEAQRGTGQLQEQKKGRAPQPWLRNQLPRMAALPSQGQTA